MKEIIKAYELLEELRIHETDILNRAGVKESKLSKRISESITELRQAEVNFISVNNCVSGNEANPKDLQRGEVALPTALHIWNNARGMAYESFKEWWTITVGNDR